VCAWKPEWDALPLADRAALNARQGMQYVIQEDLMVADPDTLEPLPWDGESLGEIMMRGNAVMKGYLKNAPTTEKSFAGGWFHTGDLAVTHPDGHIEIKDRSKDIIISGGENISSVEVESVLYAHPDIAAAAVVAKPDETWGETPCAFVELVDGASPSEVDIIAYAREHLAHFKAPRVIIFGELPKTATGKI
jgi:fatty-acyl-CoA synthase